MSLTPNQAHYASLAGATDAELLRRCRLLIEEAAYGGRMQKDMAYNAWFACVETNRRHLWKQAVAEFQMRRRAEGQRVFGRKAG